MNSLIPVSNIPLTELIATKPNPFLLSIENTVVKVKKMVEEKQYNAATSIMFSVFKENPERLIHFSDVRIPRIKNSYIGQINRVYAAMDLLVVKKFLSEGNIDAAVQRAIPALNKNPKQPELRVLIQEHLPAPKTKSETKVKFNDELKEVEIASIPQVAADLVEVLKDEEKVAAEKATRATNAAGGIDYCLLHIQQSRILSESVSLHLLKEIKLLVELTKEKGDSEDSDLLTQLDLLSKTLEEFPKEQKLPFKDFTEKVINPLKKINVAAEEISVFHEGNHAYLLNQLALQQIILEQFEEAEANINMVFDKAPHEATATRKAGDMLNAEAKSAFKAGDNRRGVKLCKQALPWYRVYLDKVNPTDQKIRERVADLYDQLGDRSKAQDYRYRATFS